ncbi:MAG TPA: nickel-dependent lactate racemase, partial [Bryobacteraceae bacterium]|nr:nickel-dependent lactate racemase [Bryobacteraceae bacterium]
FGKNGLPLDLPAGFDYKILEARSASALDDQLAAVESALDAPTAGPSITELASGKKTAAISVCDITRPAPNKLVLPPLLKRLHAAGIPRENVTILIATGLHRLATPAELDEILSPEIASTYRIVNHNARELAEHRFLGHTKSGTPVYVAEDFVAADLHITLGFIEPHLMAGFSGARKLVAPGLAAQETIKVLHSPKFMRDPKAVEGSIEGNPLHRELLEIAAMAGHHFMVDVALTRDRKVAAVFAGEPVEAHRAGMQFVSKVMLEQLPAPVDAVITSCAGYPLDLTFYQAIKGITAAQHIVKQGGKILLVAECQEGPGAAEFCEMLKKTDSGASFLDLIKEAEVVVDQWQLEKLALVTRKADILFYTPGLPVEYHKTLWGAVFAKPEDAIGALTQGLAPGATIALMPEGPYVLAKATAAA